MILEALSTMTRRELETLTTVQRRALMGDLNGDLPADIDPIVRQFFETLAVRPLVDPKADPVAMTREGRRD